MAQQIINLGTAPTGNDGDTNRVAFGKAKDNFAELYGSTVVTPRTYHVTTAGNDTTGDGSLGKPYATAQKAFDIAFADTGVQSVIQLGVGDFGNVDCPSGWPSHIALRGVSEASVIPVLTAAGDVNISGNDTVAITNITTNGADGANGAGPEGQGGSGATGCTINVKNILYGNIFSMGGSGGQGVGGDVDQPGGRGGDGGLITIIGGRSTGGVVESIGGAPGTGPGGDGSAGLSQDVTFIMTDARSVSNTGATTTIVGSSAFPEAITITTDKGGNSLW